MFKPLISIIIPLYNAEKYIDASIQSAINQTWENKEIIIIDDGSTDNSYHIAKKYKCKNIFLFKQENKGASAARNKGLSEAKGEFIQFLDADDLISTNKIEAQVLQLLDKPDHLSLCATIYFQNSIDDKKSAVYHQWFSKGFDDPIDFITKLYQSNEIGTGYGGMIQPNAWLTPKKIIEKSGNWNETISVDDDGDFFCRVILNSGGIVYSYDALNYYRKHSFTDNLSSDKSKKAFLSRLKALESKHNSLAVKTKHRDLADKVFASNFWELGVQAYPKYLEISNYCIDRAKSYTYSGAKYNGGKKGRILSKIIGWKLTRLFSHWIYKI